MGFVLANGMVLALSAALTEEQFTAWGWRVPFWAAGLLALTGLWLRRSVEETPQFRALAETGRRAKAPLSDVVRGHWRLLLLTGGALACGYAVFYAATTWSLAYATGHLGVDRTVVLACIMTAVVLQGLLTPLLAVLGDRYGRKPLCLTGCAVCAVWMPPFVALLCTSDPLLMTLGLLGGLLGMVTTFAVVGAYLPELYAPHVRCTGAAVGYNLGGVLGGALTPIVATALADGSRPAVGRGPVPERYGPGEPGLLRAPAGDEPRRRGAGRGPGRGYAGGGGRSGRPRVAAGDQASTLCGRAASSAAACFLEAIRLVTVVTARTPQMTPRETGMEICGTCTPDSCSACSSSLTPMNPRMTDRP